MKYIYININFSHFAHFLYLNLIICLTQTQRNLISWIKPHKILFNSSFVFSPWKMRSICFSHYRNCGNKRKQRLWNTEIYIQHDIRLAFPAIANQCAIFSVSVYVYVAVRACVCVPKGNNHKKPSNALFLFSGIEAIMVKGKRRATKEKTLSWLAIILPLLSIILLYFNDCLH